MMGNMAHSIKAKPTHTEIAEMLQNVCDADLYTNLKINENKEIPNTVFVKPCMSIMDNYEVKLYDLLVATLEKQVKPKPSQVTIKDSNGKTISLTFKEMLDKVSTEDELLESPQQEIPMMMKQLHFVCYAAEEIGDYLKTEGQDPEEWWQNKLAEVFSNVKSLYAYAKGDQMVNAKPMSAAKKFAKAGMAFEEIEAGSFELTNKESVQISEEDASILNTVFEHLNETNSTEMYSVLIADEAGYNEILSFAKENV